MQVTNMKKILHAFIYGMSIFLLIAAAAMFIDFSHINNRLTNFLVNAGIIGFDEGVDREQRAQVNAIFNTSFQFSRSRIEMAMTYIPIFEINELSVAEQFARDFSMPTCSVTETDISFIFHCEERTLTIYKYINNIVYLANNINAKAHATPISLQDAKIIGAQFMQMHNLPLSFNEVVVNQSNNTFVITYVSKLSGLLNYAFPTAIKMDETGFIYSVEHYFFSFERLAQCSLKTMRQAFYELPTDFPPATQIDLKRATLVYIFENSILQPAYLFEGEFKDGGTFRAFVNAARFGG